MNTCLICGHIQAVELPTCGACGEASFRFGPQASPAPAVKAPEPAEDSEPGETSASFSSRKKRK